MQGGSSVVSLQQVTDSASPGACEEEEKRGWLGMGVASHSSSADLTQPFPQVESEHLLISLCCAHFYILCLPPHTVAYHAPHLLLIIGPEIQLLGGGQPPPICLLVTDLPFSLASWSMVFPRSLVLQGLTR